MIKNLLRILASSATFVAVMLVANIAIPQNHSAIAFEAVDSVPTIVDLNVISPSLHSIYANDSSIDGSGCSCELCVRGAELANNKI